MSLEESPLTCSPHPVPQLTSDVETYAFQYETKMKSSDSTIVLYLEKVRPGVHLRLVGSLVG